jgi:hypothetical protein
LLYWLGNVRVVTCLVDVVHYYLLRKRALGDASTSRSSRNCIGTQLHACMRHWITIASHAPFVAVEDRGVNDVRVLAPVPVGLVSLIVAFCAKRNLVGPDVVAVPVHEICGCMNGGCHVHVNNGKVVVAGLCTWIHAGGEFRGGFQDAFDCSKILFSLIFRQVATAGILDHHSVRQSRATYYSFRIATVFLLQVDGRLVRPSESVPSSTLKALSSACFCTPCRVRVCLLENGHADVPVKHRAASKTLITVVPAMME